MIDIPPVGKVKEQVEIGIKGSTQAKAIIDNFIKRFYVK